MKSKSKWSKYYGKHVKIVQEARDLYKQGYVITWEDYLNRLSHPKKEE